MECIVIKYVVKLQLFCWLLAVLGSLLKLSVESVQLVPG